MATPASGSEGKISENPLFVSWVDSAWIPVLNQSNVLDYFSERTNPFYDRTCNNEILKMQKLGVADVQLTNMQVTLLSFTNQNWRMIIWSFDQGPEYCLLHVQEPILYVVRKQIRHSPTQVIQLLPCWMETFQLKLESHKPTPRWLQLATTTFWLVSSTRPLI